MLDSTTKKCTKCGEEKPNTFEFFPKKRNKTAARCKVCQYQYQREWEANNHDKVLAKGRRYQEKNKDARNASKKRYRAENRENINKKRREDYTQNADKINDRKRELRQLNPGLSAAYSKDWRKRNPQKQSQYNKTYRDKHPELIRIVKSKWNKENADKVRKTSADRRARIANAPGSHTDKDIETQFRSQKGICWHCGKPVGYNYHVDHLVPLARGGSNGARNIVISCPHCNCSRQDKMPHEWNGRLI